MSNLLKDHKELMKEYNYEKNKDFTLDKITLGSSKKIWWKCSKCRYEWEATPKNRFKGGTGCPICGLKKVGINHNKTLIAKKGSLFDNRPDLAKEWNYERNYPLTPKDVTIGSGKKIWWICKNGHEWEARIDHRVEGSGCIYCSGQKVIIGKNDIATTNPELLNEWDYEKNIGIYPEELMAGSNKKVWWKCPLGHSWMASVLKRKNGTGCPHCYSEYGTSFPEQAILYYISKVTEVESRKVIEKQEIDIYLPLFKIGFEYDGLYYHKTDKSKAKEKKKDFIIEKNGINLYHIKEANENFFDEKNKIIYCLTDRKYKYLEFVLNYIQKIIDIRINDIDIERDQSVIYNLYVKGIKDNNFTILHPELLKEWDYDKNKDLLPESLSIGSNKKVWWKCSICRSSYLSSIIHRVNGTSCPYCSGRKINETNCLATIDPELSRFWNYEKNHPLTPKDVTIGSKKTVWWICAKCNKKFQAPVCSRVKAKKYECSECMHKRIGEANKKSRKK